MVSGFRARPRAGEEPRVLVRCVCGSWMERDDRMLAGPFYMCERCWGDYWRAEGSLRPRAGEEETP